MFTEKVSFRKKNLSASTTVSNASAANQMVQRKSFAGDQHPLQIPVNNFVQPAPRGEQGTIQRQEKKDDDPKKEEEKPRFHLQLTEPDFLSMRRPFLNRGVPNLWDPSSALSVWHYNFNFFKTVGLADGLAGKAANLTAPFFIDSQLKAGNPTWWEIEDQKLNTTSIVGSVPIFDFDANFKNWKFLPFLNKKPMDNSNGHSSGSFIQKKQAGQTETAHPAVARKIESTIGNGSGLPHKTKSFMENRFGADFSNVRIHSGGYASQLSNQLNAQAFTVGNDIYFNEGKFSPESSDGKRLLAHELTHTLQQTQQINPSLIQKACHDKSNSSRKITCPEGATDIGRQAQGQPNKRDPRADAIIATAAGAGSNSDKAMQVVNDIVCSYMPGQASKVSKLNFFASEPGLFTQSVGKGAGTTGDICVGDSFLSETTKSGISRRVLQVAHELEHIDQFRSGLIGTNNHPEREFLAFYHEALAEEFIGTSRMQHGTRLKLIDAALGQYNCFLEPLKKTHASKQKELLTRRTAENGQAGNAPTVAPAGCIPQ